MRRGLRDHVRPDGLLRRRDAAEPTQLRARRAHARLPLPLAGGRDSVPDAREAAAVRRDDRGGAVALKRAPLRWTRRMAAETGQGYLSRVVRSGARPFFASARRAADARRAPAPLGATSE